MLFRLPMDAAPVRYRSPIGGQGQTVFVIPGLITSSSLGLNASDISFQAVRAIATTQNFLQWQSQTVTGQATASLALTSASVSLQANAGGIQSGLSASSSTATINIISHSVNFTSAQAIAQTAYAQAGAGGLTYTAMAERSCASGLLQLASSSVGGGVGRECSSAVLQPQANSVTTNAAATGPVTTAGQALLAGSVNVQLSISTTTATFTLSASLVEAGGVDILEIQVFDLDSEATQDPVQVQLFD